MEANADSSSNLVSSAYIDKSSQGKEDAGEKEIARFIVKKAVDNAIETIAEIAY